MNNSVGPKLAKWPFYLGDAFCLGMAYLIYAQGRLPMGAWETCFCLLTVAFGGVLGVTPFVLEYRAAVKLTEVGVLSATVDKIKSLEHVANLISGATAQWQGVHDHSAKTVAAAKEITDLMASEARAFGDFIKKANTNEKATLRLEVEKLRRAESDWLQVLTRILDHVYALRQAALRSGQPGLVEQLGRFQDACYEVSRRIGLIPFQAVSGKPFDSGNHRLVDGHAEAKPDARVSETIATGYTYQGQLLRAALVSLQQGGQGNQPVGDTASTPAARSSTESNVAATHKRMDDQQLATDSASAKDEVELRLTAKQPSLL